MPKPVTEEDLRYFISVTANSLGEICRMSTNTEFQNKVMTVMKVPIRDVENEISNILSTVWINHESDIKVLQAKRRKIMANFGAADFDSLFEDTE